MNLQALKDAIDALHARIKELEAEVEAKWQGEIDKLTEHAKAPLTQDGAPPPAGGGGGDPPPPPPSDQH